MQVSLILLFLIAFSSEFSNADNSGNNYLEAAALQNGKRFLPVLFFKANWFRALQYCRLHGMHLASPGSEEEEKQLMSAMYKSGFDVTNIKLWTSGSDFGTEGDFSWMASGKVLTYTNWGTDEPNGGGDENCVTIVNGNNGPYWNDSDCDLTFHFACEYYDSNHSILNNI